MATTAATHTAIQPTGSALHAVESFTAAVRPTVVPSTARNSTDPASTSVIFERPSSPMSPPSPPSRGSFRLRVKRT